MSALDDREQISRGVWLHPGTGRLVVRPDLVEGKKYRGAGKPKWEIWARDLSGGMFALDGEPKFPRLDEALVYLDTGRTDAYFVPADINSPWSPWQAAEPMPCVACGEPTLMRGNGNDEHDWSRARPKCADTDACRARRSALLVDLELQRWSKEDSAQLIKQAGVASSAHNSRKRYECAGNGDAGDRQHTRGCPGIIPAGGLYVATTSHRSRAFGMKVCASPQCFESYWAAREE